MAMSNPILTEAKLVFNLGFDGEKLITKARVIKNINILATDDQVYEFGMALAKLQVYSAEVSRIDTEMLYV